MKKTTTIIAALLASLVLLTSCTPSTTATQHTHPAPPTPAQQAQVTMSTTPAPTYTTQAGTINHIDNEYIHVVFEDGTGWACDYEAGFTVGDTVTLTISDNGTTHDYDDECMSISK